MVNYHEEEAEEKEPSEPSFEILITGDKKKVGAAGLSAPHHKKIAEKERVPFKPK